MFLPGRAALVFHHCPCHRQRPVQYGHRYGWQVGYLWLVVALIQVSHGSKNSQPSPDGSLCIIFMGLGIPKIHEETIAEELGDVPVIAVNHPGTGGLVRMHHITIVFRIELRCQYSGVGEVDKHHGQLTAFGFWGAWFPWRYGLGRWLFLGDRLLRWLSRLRGDCLCAFDAPVHTSPR